MKITPPGIVEGHQDALVITAMVDVNSVKKVLIDNKVQSIYYIIMPSLEWIWMRGN